MIFGLDCSTGLLFALSLMIERREVLIPSSFDKMVRTQCMATVLFLHWILLEERFRLHMLFREVAVDDR